MKVMGVFTNVYTKNGSAITTSQVIFGFRSAIFCSLQQVSHSLLYLWEKR